MSEKIVVFGKTGSGKTNLCKVLARMKRRVIYFDPVMDFQDEGVVLNELRDLRTHLIEGFLNNDFRFVLTPKRRGLFGGMSKDAMLNYLCYFIIDIPRCTLVIDEVNVSTKAGYCPPYFEELIRFSKHCDIDIIANTQRPADTSRLLTSQADKIVSFVQHEPRDIAYFKEFIGSENAERLRNLREYEYLIYEKGTTRICKSEKA